ncbi:Actin cytoskeleton-regulatory complex protein SLA1 [Leucoagaricus sp. SymC.cos]|nr:Actin cytoskeleton-regulatory complex protein SLA1 [Leucoagaricus sp. SymC.cos]
MPIPDPERYLAVLKASYDYEPQSDDEIAIKENQILFLIERTDDDWWKVKVKGDSQDAHTLVGLVPMAYVEQAEHKYLVKVLYDYEAAAPGELTIGEDDVLMAFEPDEDWLLVQSQKENGGAGYVPGNYVEETTGEEPPSPPRIIVPSSVCPPFIYLIFQTPESVQNPRPVSTYVDPADRVAASKVTADDIKTWSVSEVDKKGKKKKGTLGIGNGSVFFASESDKAMQKWQTSDIIAISNEKSKHVGIEIGGVTPTTLLFNVGSKDNVEAIMKKLEASRDLSRPSAQDSPSPQPESSRFVAPSQKTPEKGTATNGNPAVALYDFTADGEDELSVTEGEELMVIEREGDEWWKCRNAHGAEGVVPMSYLELKDGASTPASRAYPPQAEEEEPEDDGAAAAARAAREAADRAEAERLQREEEERATKEQRQKRKEAAAAAAAKRSPSPGPEPRNNTPSSARKSQEVTFPPAEHVRTWHDRTGQFRVDAAFLGFSNGKLRLHKINGVIVEVPSEKMSLNDMKFVEKLTRKSRGSSSGQDRRPSDDDIPLATLQNSISSPPRSQIPPASSQTHKRKGPRIDWFDFFLSAGCDMDDCTRYASAFDRDKIDESILPDITDSTMRSLGLREGDIIRVKKAIERRRPGENMEKHSTYIQQQMKKDEELAKQLQAQENAGGSTRTPAPNLFAGAGGVLKNPRRGRKETTKTLPTNVDLNALSSASEQINRTASPQANSPTTRPGSAPIQLTKVNSPLHPTPSGFDDDAWAPRPSSTKPTTASAPSPSSSAPAAPALAPTPPAPPSSAPPATSAPAHTPAAPATAVPPAPTSGTPSKGPSQTTESDVFDQLARLSQLRVTSQSSAQSQPQQQPNSTPVVAPPSFSAGLGMGNLAIPISQALAAQQAGLIQSSPQPQPQSQPQIQAQQPHQPYNGPRGPFAPVPANQGLLQPLIPTQTGFNSFVPTRPTNNPSPSSLAFQNQQSPNSSFMAPQPTGMPGGLGIHQQQPMMSQPTGLPGSGFSSSPFGSGSMMNASPFGSGSTFQPTPGVFNPTPVTVQPTGVFAQSPFSNPTSPPPVLPVTSGNSNTSSTAPASVFASMKSGTFGKEEDHSAPQSADKYNALRPNLTPQPTGWGYNGYSGF